MRLATRTGLASFVAASITLFAVGALFRGYFASVLQDRVDTQLLGASRDSADPCGGRRTALSIRTANDPGRRARRDRRPDDLVGVAAGRPTSHGDRARLLHRASKRRPLEDVHRRRPRRATTRRPCGGAAGRATRRRRCTGDATTAARHLRDGADVGGGRAGRVPARKGRDQAADCATTRYEPHRRCRAEHLACRELVRVERSR